MNAIQLGGAVNVLLLIVIIGVASGRRVRNNADFESGGGTAGCGTVAGMILGTVVGGSCTIGTAQMAYHNGLSAWWYTLGCGLACLIMGLLYVKPFRRTEATTLLGIIRKEYGHRVAVATSLLASFAALIGLVAQVITALMVEPNEHPKAVQLHTDLDSLQKAVSIGADYQGLIELINLDANAVLLCNEEGKLIGLPGNRRIGCDVIAGVFYIIGQNNHGDLVSLAPELIETYKTRFWEPENLSAQDVEHAMFMRFFAV